MAAPGGPLALTLTLTLILTLTLTLTLHQAGGWRVLPAAVRRVLVDYDVTFNPP